MKIYKLVGQVIFFVFLSSCLNKVHAQSGDQILDGIGETSLNLRYRLNGDLKDWSRNNFHGKMHGGDVKFVEDKRFGKVLSLTGATNSFMSIPAGAFADLESISIASWMFLRSNEVNQHFFDFGKDSTKHFFAIPTGTKVQDGFQIAFTANGSSNHAGLGRNVPINKWIYVVIVVDIPAKAMRYYIDGKIISEVKDLPLPLDEVLVPKQGQPQHFYIGKSIASGNPNLNALVHDFRIYRVPLSAKQISGLYQAQGAAEQNIVNVGKREDELPKFAPGHAQLYNRYLTSVADIKLVTAVGNLPQLPAYLPGTYQNGKKWPKVRVIWPAATNNTDVLKVGKYTVIGRVPGTNLEPKAFVTVNADSRSTPPKIKLAAFPLSQVTLLNDLDGKPTKFIENRDKFIRTLAETDPNSFLYMFRQTYGQTQPSGAKPLGGWDTEETKLRGHATGHYLSAIAQAYASTGFNKNLQANFAKKIENVVNTLYTLSKLSGQPQTTGGAFVADPNEVPFGPRKSGFDSDLAADAIRSDYWNWGKGYISAYPPDQFIMLEKGAKYGGQKNQIWAPYYTLHKILAGLLDVYEITGNKKALEIATNMSDWVYARLSKLPQQTLIKMWNTYIAGEFGGMNESMARLYRITQNPNYLKTAQLFDNVKVFYGDTYHSHGLAKNVDLFRGLHANQHIPQIVGSIEMYRASNNSDYYNIANNFWHKMVNDYMYSIGGVAGARNPANAECFVAQPSSLYENGFSEGGQNETCATYNMLKLTGELFLFDPRPELMDYYERGLYNHILASVAENSPANTYHVPLRPGSIKQFGNADMTGFTCCNGTSLESNTKLQNTIYYKTQDNKALYVNLFIPSTLTWTEKKITVIQSTNFPREDFTRLTIKGSGEFELNIRVPAWATKGFSVTINGKKQQLSAQPSSYLKIKRRWKSGDIVELKMPFQFRLDPVMDQQNIASLFYGPILLAAQEPEARIEWRKITLSASDLSTSIKGNPQKLEFKINDVLFKPFYESYGRHSVYLDVMLE